jgi:hypothetical protein
MPRSTPSFDAVRTLARALPGVEEGTTYGSPALRIGGRMFACIAIHRSAESRTLAVRIPFDTRDRLMRAKPSVYYVTDHYVNHPCVLVRLGRVSRTALRALLRVSAAFVASGAPLAPRDRSTARAGAMRRVRPFARRR